MCSTRLEKRVHASGQMHTCVRLMHQHLGSEMHQCTFRLISMYELSLCLQV